MLHVKLKKKRSFLFLAKYTICHDFNTTKPLAFSLHFYFLFKKHNMSEEWSLKPSCMHARFACFLATTTTSAALLPSKLFCIHAFPLNPIFVMYQRLSIMFDWRFIQMMCSALRKSFGDYLFAIPFVFSKRTNTDSTVALMVPQYNSCC